MTEKDSLEQVKADLERAAKEAVKQVGFEATEMMIHHVSGDPISWDGGTFQINVNTGNLRRHVRMEYPYSGSEYAVGVFNNAAYASDVEDGVSGEERKSRLLWGGQSPRRSQKTGRAYKIIPRQEGSLVAFWAVTEDSTLQDQPPRPFVEATESKMQDRAAAIMGEVLVREGEKG